MQSRIQRLSSVLMFLYTYLLCIGLVSFNHAANVNDQVILQSNNVMPTQGNSLLLSCLIQDVVNDNTITWNEPKSNTDVVCTRLSRACYGSPEGYSYTANNSGSYVDITRINRNKDEGTWTCKYRGLNRTDTVRTLNITVYTLPSMLVYTEHVQAPTDLSVSNLTLQCKTSNCTYPPPFIKWYYKTQTSPIASGVYSVGIGMTSSTDSCLSQEKIYTSTLQIRMYTTWSDNSDMSVTFYCGIDYPDDYRNIKSTDSGAVRFAVAVRSVTLNISESEVVFYEGYPQMLSCISSPSRPLSTIKWFLGSRLLTDNITTTNTSDTTGLYTLTSQILLTLMKNASNEKIKCEGFIGGQQAVISNEKPSVNVWCGMWLNGSSFDGAGIHWQNVPSPTAKICHRIRQSFSFDSYVGLYSPNSREDKPNKPLVREYGGANREFTWIENTTGTLQCYSSDFGNPYANVTWLSNRGVMNSDNNLVITELMPSDDKREVSCKLVNSYTSDKNIQIMSDHVILKVEYRPVIRYNASDHLLMNETQSISVVCEAVGNPNPQSVQWKNRPDGSKLRFDNISRMDNGTYTCEATSLSNKYGKLTSQKQMDIIVQHAPVVKVTLTGSNVQNQTVKLICEVQGIPAQYTFYTWGHMWEDMVIRTGLHGTTSDSQSILTIDRLSLESIGTYICTANNGITGINGNINQTGSANLTITGIPTILGDNGIFFGEIGISVNISIPFYSDPVIQSIVIKRNGTEIINNSRTMAHLSSDIINYTFYGSPVKLRAQKAYFAVQNLTLEDFDNYTFELNNSLYKASFGFQLVAFGIPLMVKRFYFNRFIESQIELHFDPGFNGGPSQTFVIEEKSAASSSIDWQNTSVTQLLETEGRNQFENGTFFVNVSKPVIPGIYEYRMYSWNIKGKSSFSNIITVTVPEAAVQPEDHDTVAAVAGGIGAAVVLIAAVAGILVFVKRRSSKKTETGLDENQIYQSSGPTSTSGGVAGAEFALVVQAFPNTEDSRNLYAQVVRSNKTGKTEEIYENATLKGKSSNPEEVYTNPEKVMTDHYGEYPGAAASTGPKMNRNGLIYADLVLGTPKTKNGKPVIRGLENITEYAEIAYGKRGQPLPDIDDEKEK